MIQLVLILHLNSKGFSAPHETISDVVLSLNFLACGKSLCIFFFDVLEEIAALLNRIQMATNCKLLQYLLKTLHIRYYILLLSELPFACIRSVKTIKKCVN